MNLQEVINRRFKGILSAGKHEEDGVACVLEAYSVHKELPWTDNPKTLKIPDIRSLNDANWSSDELRTKYMIALVEACEKSTPEKILRIVLRTITEILPLVLPEKIGKACAAAETFEEAAYAARAANEAAREANAAARAAYAVASAAARAAYAAASAAASAADAAASAADAADLVLIRACNIWIEEMQKET